MKSNTCCFTGHRHIPEEKMIAIKTLLENQIEMAISANVFNFICGGAVGFDLLCGETVVKYKKVC